MPRFTQKVHEALSTSGWYEGRRVDTSRAVSELNKKGFSVSAAARAVMDEFYGLSVSDISFLQDRMLGVFPGADELELIAPLVGEPPCPIAYAAAGFAFVLPSGRVLHLDDSWYNIAFEGCIETYIERVCLHDKPFSTVVLLRDEQKHPDWRDG